jgi:hypothetical protein
MKKTRFTETQIVRALKREKKVERPMISAESLRLAKPPFITGKAVTVAWRYRMSSA